MEPLMLNASKTLLPDILAAHGRWVASGGKEGERADFSDAMLEEVDLAAADLDIARFRRANLRRANLSGANPKGADRSEEHTSELQSLMGRSDAVCSLKHNTIQRPPRIHINRAYYEVQQA